MAWLSGREKPAPAARASSRSTGITCSTRGRFGTLGRVGFGSRNTLCFRLTSTRLPPLRSALQGTAFTHRFAAPKRRPYADVPVGSAYVRHLPDSTFLEALVARVVPANGRLRLLVPDDEGAFQLRRNVSGLTLVSDVQIYLDVVHAGLRGDEAAAALRDWDEFCR